MIVYSVFASKLVRFTELVVTVFCLVPFTNTSYPVTATLSVEATHEIEAEFEVMSLTVIVPGTEGASESEQFGLSGSSTAIAGARKQLEPEVIPHSKNAGNEVLEFWFVQPVNSMTSGFVLYVEYAAADW